MGAAEIAPYLDDAVGGRGADLLDVTGDLLGERLGQLLLHLVLVLLRLHLGGDDRQHAVAQIPDVLGDEHEADAAGDHRDEARQHAADDALADAGRHVGELAAHEQHGGAGDAAARLAQHGARRHLGGALAGIDGDVLAGVAGDGARSRLAVARADKRLQAGERRLGRVATGELHLLADLVADPDRQLLERGLDGVRAVDALGDRRRQLLRLLLVGERLQQVGPAGLLADFLDGEIDAVVDDLVHADAAPLVADGGAVIDAGDAGLQRPHRDALDGGLEGALVTRLAGFVVDLGQRLREGGGDLSGG